MQTIVQVICTPGISLRDAIGTDPRIGEFQLQVTKQQTAGRSPGWSKLHSSAEPPRPGAVNIEWNARASILTCRVVTRSARHPSPIVGDLINYLAIRFTARVRTISIIPRRT